jgi:hypothetical protein
MHAVVDVPADQADAARAFWSEVIGWPNRRIAAGCISTCAEVDRVRALGATPLRPGGGLVALRDPVGLPFSVTGNDPGAAEPA